MKRILQDYRETLKRFLGALSGRTDMTARVLTRLLKHDLKWAGPNQRRGVINKNDLLEVGGQQALEIVQKLIDANDKKHSN